MALGSHLDELRKRLSIAALFLVLGMAAGFMLSDWVIDALRAPITDLALSQDRTAALNFSEVTSAFDLRLQIAFTVGVILSSPVWLYELWAFVLPGLSKKERRYSGGFVGAAVPLFAAGCAAGWFLLSHMVALLLSFAPSGTSTLLTARSYAEFVLKLMLVVGLAFVLPLFLVLMNTMGLISARSIWRSWRVAIMAIVTFTAIATPSADVVSMFLLAIPMVLLYVGAGGIASLTDSRRARAVAQAEPHPVLTHQEIRQ